MNRKIEIQGVLECLPSVVKKFLFVFLLVLSFGYGTGLYYLNKESGVSAQGVEEQYLGNEENEEAEEMKFKMSEKALLTLVHGHVISFGLIFFLLGGMFMFSSYSNNLKLWLGVEPLISTITTFLGVWLLWYDFIWVKYVVIVSGTLMHVSFICLVTLIARDLLKKIN